ncbi:MAG: ABC transporter permease [Geodermatophilaceae bacterium]|nr:ABC transporter permease [Geodermatophilaceae bacterium]
MFFFTIRRLLSSILVLLASSMLVFALCVASFDPLSAYRQRQPPPPPQFFEALTEQLSLDQPFFVRYFTWLKGVVTLDFGVSNAGTPVGPVLIERLGITARMVVAAIVLAILLAIVVGVLTAVRQYKPEDYFFTFLTYVLIALPTFWFAALLKEFVAIQFNDLVGQRILFTLGEQSPAIELTGTGSEIFWDRVGHLVLPTISLAMLSFAAWSRFQRASLLDVLGSDYMRLARAKGLPYRSALLRHGLRNALIPLTTVVALGVGSLLGGAVITETVFVWHGMGEYLIMSINRDDLNPVLGWMMVAAFFVIAFNLIADLLYAVLDPRIRLS